MEWAGWTPMSVAFLVERESLAAETACPEEQGNQRPCRHVCLTYGNRQQGGEGLGGREPGGRGWGGGEGHL